MHGIVSSEVMEMGIFDIVSYSYGNGLYRVSDIQAKVL